MIAKSTDDKKKYLGIIIATIIDCDGIIQTFIFDHIVHSGGR